MKFKKEIEQIYTSDFWYDLTDGGYIKPELLLEDEDAKKVQEAIDLLMEFKDQCENMDIVIAL